MREIATTVTERIDALQEQIDELREVAEQEAQEPTGVQSDPAVQDAAKVFAQAVAKSLGIDLPLEAAQGTGNLPVITVPPEFVSQGGIGIAVLVAQPQ